MPGGMSDAGFKQIRAELLKHGIDMVRDQGRPGSRRNAVDQARDDTDVGLRPDLAEHIAEGLQGATLEDLGGLQLGIGPAASLVHVRMNI